MTDAPAAQRHTWVRMVRRDPHEAGRAATPLELLFDLTFVIAYGTASSQLAHTLAEGHLVAGVAGFGFACFAVAWAWFNFTWFASAYDVDDWIYRLLTMVQMAGVLVLALGLPAMFHSLVEGEYVDNRVMVIGYVIMRVPMLLQWLRAGYSIPTDRRICWTYAGLILVAQVLWLIQAFAHTSLVATAVWVLVLGGFELLIPVIAERPGRSTPWHPHHIAERFSLMIIIALGEGVLGTVSALGALGPVWSRDVVLLGLAGVGLIFGIWWIYFAIPYGALLHRHAHRSFGWGYGHIFLFGVTVAIGAGLHLAALYFNDESRVGRFGTLAATAIPVSLFLVLLFALYSLLTRSVEAFHLLLLVISAAVVCTALGMAAAGAPLAWCLMVLAFTPWVTVIGYETIGYRHATQALA